MCQVNNLTDGNTESFIVLHADDPDPWFAVDLGEKTKFNKLALYWGSGESYTDSYRAKYTVEGSDSLESGYQVITSAESTKAGLSEITFDRSEYQFVRIHVTEKAGTYCGLYEMEVYNEETSEEESSESSSEGSSSESSSAGGSADKADTGSIAGKLGEVNGLKISKITANKLTVSWSKAEADGYRLLLTQGGKIVKRVMTTKTSYTFKKLKAASVYNISVQVCKAESGGMVYGAEKKMAAKTAPAKVKMKGMSVENQVISLNWRKVKGASGYEVYVKKGNGKYKKVKTNLRKNSIKIKWNTSGTYRFRIRAYTKYKSKKIRGAYVKTKAIQL